MQIQCNSLEKRIPLGSFQYRHDKAPISVPRHSLMISNIMAVYAPWYSYPLFTFIFILQKLPEAIWPIPQMDILKVNFLKTTWFRSSGVKTKICTIYELHFINSDENKQKPWQVTTGTEILRRAFSLYNTGTGRYLINKSYEPGFSLLLLLFGWRRAVRLRWEGMQEVLLKTAYTHSMVHGNVTQESACQGVL